jgi:hypothetical protein
MKKLLLVLGAATMVACMHDRDRDTNTYNDRTMNEPAGAQNTNSMNAMPARDINQQPYPGQSDLNQQRGSGSASDSSLQGSSGSSTESGSFNSGTPKTGASRQNP